MSGNDYKRRIITAPTLLASVEVSETDAHGAEPCGQVVEIYPVTVGSSGSFTITDGGNMVFTIAAADVVQGVPIMVPARTCITDITVSSVPTGGEYGILWEGAYVE